MKNRIILIAALIIMLAGVSFGDEQKRPDPNQLFYTGNLYYEKGDYIKAIDAYLKVLDLGVDNGNLYYNIGNGFLKMGKVGYSILCYEKARRLMPQDSDLKSNLAYARSLVELGPEVYHRNIIVRAIGKVFQDLDLNLIGISLAVLYALLTIVLIIFILYPFAARRFTFLLVIILAFFFFDLGAFGVRYYGEQVLKHGIVVQKNVECKYEPIDKSTTYYKLGEGAGVLVLKTKNDWRQVRRFDGKIGWVKKEAVEGI